MANPPPDPVTGLPYWVDNSRIGSGAGADFEFDPFLNLPIEEQERLYVALEPMLDRGRKRSRKAEDRQNVTQVVGCVVANAIIAMERGPRTAVHYSRGKATYAGASPYHPIWLSSKLLRQVVDQLRAADLLRAVDADPAPIGRHRSTYEVRPPVLDLLAELGIGKGSVHRDEQHAPVVYLRDQKCSLQSYDQASRKVANSIAILRAWNAQMAAVEIGVAGGQPDFVPPAAGDHKRLYRLFDNSFDEHGRFYGGWWQSKPKEVRERITINGKPTVELDFASFNPRVLYHEAGIELQGDAYDVAEIRAAARADGMDWKDVRPVVKRVFNYMLNAKGRGGYGSAAFVGWPPSLKKADGVRAIEKKHAAIKDRFFQGDGMRLMNVDSDICEAVLAAGVHDGIPVLPIHDSFLVQTDHEEWLRTQMKKAYRQRLGFDPVVS